MASDERLAPPSRGALWLRLALTKTQLAALCGVTVRQIGHWTAQGYLPTAPQRADRYSGEAVDLCGLIKQGLAQGVPLKRAVTLARAAAAAEITRQESLPAIAPATLAEIAVALRAARGAVSGTLMVIEPLVPDDDHREELSASVGMPTPA